MICLDVGLWSGIRRNMEIAESFGQPLIIVSPLTKHLLS